MPRRRIVSANSVLCPRGGKVCYGTRAAAKDAMWRIKQRAESKGYSLDNDYPIYVYECPHCYLWHIGHDLRRPHKDADEE